MSWIYFLGAMLVAAIVVSLFLALFFAAQIREVVFRRNANDSSVEPRRPVADALVGQLGDPRYFWCEASAPPVDLVSTSGVILDAYISPLAAQAQISRVAGARGLDVTIVRALVASATEGRLPGFTGEPRVDVLRLNLALDAAR